MAGSLTLQTRNDASAANLIIKDAGNSDARRSDKRPG